MTDKNGHVRWPSFVGLAVSLLGIIVSLTVWGASQVIANDRMRASEDVRITEKIERLLSENSMEHRQIMGDLREMKAKMGIAEHGVRMQ